MCLSRRLGDRQPLLVGSLSPGLRAGLQLRQPQPFLRFPVGRLSAGGMARAVIGRRAESIYPQEEVLKWHTKAER